MADDNTADYAAAVKILQKALGDLRPKTAIVLGTGLSAAIDGLGVRSKLPFDKVPGMPMPSVIGHPAQFVVGELPGSHRAQPILMMQGRPHYYEGHSMAAITLPIRLFRDVGIKTLMLTCAAGGINDDLKPGDLMFIEDHINLMGNSPLRGVNRDEFGPRFPDMSGVYDPLMIANAMKVGGNALPLKRGIFAAMAGPQYETPAEVRMLKKLGVDAVGMSTVPEAIVASHQNMKLLAVALITNFAAGIAKQPLSHDEVVACAAQAGEKLVRLLLDFAETLHNG